MRDGIVTVANRDSAHNRMVLSVKAWLRQLSSKLPAHQPKMVFVMPGVRMQAIQQDAPKRNSPLWIQLCFVLAGMGFDWNCAFEWFAKRHALFSEPVLIRMGGIVVWCAAAAFLIVCVVRRARFRDAAAIFFLLSGEVWFYLTTTWIVHPNRWR